MNNKENNSIAVMAQSFYGNRMGTEINIEDIDRFILGYIDNSINVSIDEKIDRTIIKVPNTDNLVIVYNKYEEEKCMENKDKMKPTAIIPELDMEIYSRCIVCRMNENGEFESLKEEDYDKFINYLAE